MKRTKQTINTFYLLRLGKYYLAAAKNANAPTNSITTNDAEAAKTTSISMAREWQRQYGGTVIQMEITIEEMADDELEEDI